MRRMLVQLFTCNDYWYIYYSCTRYIGIPSRILQHHSTMHSTMHAMPQIDSILSETSAE